MNIPTLVVPPHQIIQICYSLTLLLATLIKWFVRLIVTKLIGRGSNPDVV
jgi:hypothetical protein